MKSLDTCGPTAVKDAGWLDGQVLTLSNSVAGRVDRQTARIWKDEAALQRWDRMMV